MAMNLNKQMLRANEPLAVMTASNAWKNPLVTFK